MTEVHFLELVEAICKRPKMYSPSGTFFETFAFLDGCGMSLENRTSHCTFTPFLQWLAEPDEQGRRWPVSLHDFLKKAGSDDEAIKEFALLYRKYTDSKQAQ